MRSKFASLAGCLAGTLILLLGSPAGAASLFPDATIDAHVVSCGATCGTSLSVTTGSGSANDWIAGADIIGSSMGYLLVQIPPPSNTVGSTSLLNNVGTFSVGGSSTTFTATTSPSITTTQNTTPNLGTDASGRLDYWFEVVGSGGTASITVRALLSTAASAGDASQVAAQLVIVGTGLPNDSITGNSTYHESGTYTVNENTFYEVELITNLECGGLTPSCSASIDPTITSNTPGVTLVFSPNLASTPLPAALPLFASGLGVMGLFGWRRKRKNVAASAAA